MKVPLMNLFQRRRDCFRTYLNHYSNRIQDSGNYEELTSEIMMMLQICCGRTRQFKKVGTWYCQGMFIHTRNEQKAKSMY